MATATPSQTLKSLTRDDTFRDQFRTQDEGLTALVTYQLTMPAALWFVAQVADALVSMEIDTNWIVGGTVTIDEATQAAQSMNWSFRPMIGFIFPIVLASIPPNMLLCDGSTYLRTDYPELYAALDAAFIVDADHFVVPDLRDQVIMGASATNTPNTALGEATHTLTVAETPVHGHTDTGHNHVEGNAIASVAQAPVVPIPAAIPGLGVTGVGNANITNTGGGGAHNNIQPSIALNYGIVAT